MSDIQGYCVRCKTQRAIADIEAIFTENGRPAVRGRCPECGTAMFRFGETALHEGMTPPPPAERAPREKTKKPAKAASAAKATTRKASSKAKPSRKGKASSKAKAAPRGRRTRKLVIVESPAKARTIGKYLGSDYDVVASLGHVRDLLKSRLSVDVEDNFTPTYRVPDEKKETVRDIAAAASRASEIWLATDPDREGEAIAWHLVEAAGLGDERLNRVVFHEITPRAIKEAFAHPRPIDMKRVDAQQARRILDRLVGFNLSPLLWQKVRGRLSAGRVQSVALRMLVEREREVREFVPEEYWSLRARLAQQEGGGTVIAKLNQLEGEEPTLRDEMTVQQLLPALQRASYRVTEVKQSERRRRPSAPFTTSTLQQEASRRLGFSTTRTMALAQQLYEGISLGDEGETGLITYMRTDSVTVSRDAQDEARDYIAGRFGGDFVPDELPVYKSRAKNAQEAHEAIRPTSVYRTPDEVARYLDKPQQRLYTLIWQRFVASQMAPALLDQTTVDIVAEEADGTSGRFGFRASGSVVRFAGFMALYEESRDEDSPAEDDAGRLPDLAVDERLTLDELIPAQHFTQPPPRYTDATLVRALEENGIGRPSTYAPTVATLADRGYAERDEKRLVPTELGEIVTGLLVEYFPGILNVGFTAQMESELDQIAEGDMAWPQVLRDFYTPFSERLATAHEEMDKVELVDEPAGIVCEKCGRDMVIKWGRYGKFIACPGFPECRNTIPYLEKIGVPCPQCGTGDLAEKRTKGGRIFYGCSNYPACDFLSWKRPVAQPCPDCGGMLVEANRRQYQCLRCEHRFDREAEPVAG